ncbi:MAG: hypothetical protein LBN43_09435 [Oscillospiraceae bacterium]|jgi:hypothetical protein|nr:hypothetical protein [Oscillospiraceae bacterium]
MPNTVYGLYKNGQVYFDEPITVPGESKVMVVFLNDRPKHKLTDIFGLLGPWEDSRTAEEIISDVRASRIERADAQL